MTAKLRTIHVPPDSDLARALREASEADGRIVVDTGEARYNLSISRADLPPRSPEQVEASIADIEATAGAWKNLDMPRRQRRAPYLPTLADPEDIWAGYDPERVKQALRESAGVFRDLDRDEFLQDLKEQGQQDSSGRPFDA